MSEVYCGEFWTGREADRARWMVSVSSGGGCGATTNGRRALENRPWHALSRHSRVWNEEEGLVESLLGEVLLRVLCVMLDWVKLNDRAV